MISSSPPKVPPPLVGALVFIVSGRYGDGFHGMPGDQLLCPRAHDKPSAVVVARQGMVSGADQPNAVSRANSVRQASLITNRAARLAVQPDPSPTSHNSSFEQIPGSPRLVPSAVTALRWLPL